MSFEFNQDTMSETVQYSFNDEDKILFRTFKVDASMSAVIESWEHIIENNMLTPDIKGVISDYRYAEVDFTMSEIVQLGDFYKQNSRVFQRIKLAQVINSPKIIFSKIFKEENPNLKTMPFSTIESATNWILYDTLPEDP